MARRTGLREFQLSVAERIRTASTRAALSSKLGFQVGSENWFCSLQQVNEVIPVPATIVVPLTHSWFRGVSNVRGNPASVIDFAAFQGGDVTTAGVERRVILISDRLMGGAGLLVSRMLGLRSPEQFTAAASAPPTRAPGWAAVYLRMPAEPAGSNSICPLSFESSGSWKLARRRHGMAKAQTVKPKSSIGDFFKRKPKAKPGSQAAGVPSSPWRPIRIVVDDDQHQGAGRHQPRRARRSPVESR